MNSFIIEMWRFACNEGQDLINNENIYEDTNSINTKTHLVYQQSYTRGYDYTEDELRSMIARMMANKPVNNFMDDIRPTPEDQIKIDDLIKKYGLETQKKGLYYHFNIGDWIVDLADTKKSQINYNFIDLLTQLEIKLYRDEKETKNEFYERKKAITEKVQSDFLDIYKRLQNKIETKLTPIVQKYNYKDLLNLFNETYPNTPFDLEPLLEQMALLMGNKSVMQNVVGDSGSFKSTRSMIEYNSLPSVLRMDDATIAGISRNQLQKGHLYLDNTVVYYEDVGDSHSLRRNFDECLETVYKKLYSEGIVNRSIAKKNSDNTLNLHLETPHGFKCKFNSVRPLFSNDYGQTKSRVQTINIPSFTENEVLEMVGNGTFGQTNITEKDPRYFKYIFKQYMKKQSFKGFTDEFKKELAEIAIKDNNGEVNMHSISKIIYTNEMMFRLYGEEYYKEYYFTPQYVIRKRISDRAMRLKDEIYSMCPRLFYLENIQNNGRLDNYIIAKSKSAHSHASRTDFDSFTITAVNGMRCKFVNEHKAEIPTLLKVLEDNEEIYCVGDYRGKNVYVLLEKESKY